MSKRAKKVQKAIDEVRAYLAEEYIVSSCVNQPVFGCASCDAIDLDKKLLALRESVA